MRPYLKKHLSQKELVEWLKVYTLISSPSTTKKKGGQPFLMEWRRSKIIENEY
jgi:hypothetical protein